MKMKLIAAIALLTLLSACGEDDISLLGGNAGVGDNNVTQPDQFIAQDITLSGTTVDDSHVVVEAQADGDGTVDKQWTATFALDGAASAGSLPADTGARRSYRVYVCAEKASDGTKQYREVTVTLYE
jgi:hypothetical protein